MPHNKIYGANQLPTYPQDDGTIAASASGESMTGDQRSEIAERWEAVAIEHDFADGTTHQWTVRYTSQQPGFEGATVQLADWLDEQSAHLIAAAPELLAALKAIDAHWTADNFTRDPRLWLPMRAAIAKAEGREP